MTSSTSPCSGLPDLLGNSAPRLGASTLPPNPGMDFGGLGAERSLVPLLSAQDWPAAPSVPVVGATSRVR